jgi:hypothetical protein
MAHKPIQIYEYLYITATFLNKKIYRKAWSNIHNNYDGIILKMVYVS